MSTPIIELIAEHLKTTINLVTKEAGFDQTLRAIRPRRIDFLQNSWRDLDVIISQIEAEMGEGGYPTKEWNQYFLLTCIVVDSDSEENPIDSRCNQVAADIEKKLLEDTTRGGLAIDTKVHATTMVKEPEITGIAIQISVQYRTKENDPYTQA